MSENIQQDQQQSKKPVVMILSAGKGKRMQPLTDVRPKPLLLVRGFPLIGYQMEKFTRFGVSNFVVNTSYLEEMFGLYFDNGKRNLSVFAPLGVQKVFLSSEKSKPLETAGGIAKALPLITAASKAINGEENAEMPFFVASCDSFFETDLEGFYNRFADKLKPGEAALLLVKNPYHNKRGDFYFDPESEDNRLGEIKNRFFEPPRPNFNNRNKYANNNFERPPIELDPNRQTYTYSGIGIFTPKFFKGVNPNYPKRLSSLFMKALKEGRLYGELGKGFWLDIGTPQRLEQLSKHLVKKGIPPRIMEYWKNKYKYLYDLNLKPDTQPQPGNENVVEKVNAENVAENVANVAEKADEQ